MKTFWSAALVLAAGWTLATGQHPATPAVDGRRALAHVRALAEDLGPRIPGGDGERRAAAYIEAVFREIGYPVTRQEFSFVDREGRSRRAGESANVIAVKAGLSDRPLIVGAHYDSRGEGRGADDNASGVGVLLEVAEALHGQDTPYTIHFVAFGAEEAGFAGSRRFVQLMDRAAIEHAVAMINLDSLVAGDHAYVYGDAGDRGAIRDWTLRLAEAEGLALGTQSGLNRRFPAGTTGDFSDHAPFRRAGIPYAYFESTNWALGEQDGYTQVDPRFGEDGYIWHTPFDTSAYIEATFPGRIGERLQLFSRVLYRVLTEFTAS